MFSSVLIVHDGSPGSESALSVPGRLAAPPSEVVFARVIEPTSGNGDARSRASVEAEEWLSSVRNRAPRDYQGCTVDVLEGAFLDQVVSACRRHRSRLIVMAAPSDADGDGPDLDLPNRIVERSLTPVVLVPPSPDVQCMDRVRRVVVVLDGSAAAEDAVPAAVELADRLRVELALIEAIDAGRLASPLSDPRASELNERFRASLRDQAGHYLRRVAEDWTRPGRFVTWAVMDGPPVATIAREAGPGDLVVAAALTCRDARRRLPGGLASLVAARCPALVMLAPPAPVPVATPAR